MDSTSIKRTWILRERLVVESETPDPDSPVGVVLRYAVYDPEADAWVPRTARRTLAAYALAGALDDPAAAPTAPDAVGARTALCRPSTLFLHAVAEAFVGFRFPFGHGLSFSPGGGIVRADGGLGPRDNPFGPGSSAARTGRPSISTTPWARSGGVRPFLKNRRQRRRPLRLHPCLLDVSGLSLSSRRRGARS